MNANDEVVAIGRKQSDGVTMAARNYTKTGSSLDIEMANKYGWASVASGPYSLLVRGPQGRAEDNQCQMRNGGYAADGSRG
jgi:hypothetical protein